MSDKLKLVQQTMETQLRAVLKRWGEDAVKEIPVIKELMPFRPILNALLPERGEDESCILPLLRNQQCPVCYQPWGTCQHTVERGSHDSEEMVGNHHDKGWGGSKDPFLRYD